MSYVHQLECIGLWEWGVYVVLNMPKWSSRSIGDLTLLQKSVVQSILDRHVEDICAHSEKEDFLLKTLCVPKAMIDSAKAIFAHYSGDYKREIEYLMNSAQWERAHHIFAESIAAKLFLEGSSQPCNFIVGSQIQQRKVGKE